ncbi:MAG: CBS domain containing-hemolysin-like protein [Paraglaciecola sp.]|jgi:CBS domain containing-hemolysin-like protein
MLLLFIYIVIALGFSFICSVAEAVILSVSSAYISVMEKKQQASAKLLRSQVDDINRPLAAILTLNTIAHTMGAAGAGAQAARVFGDAYLGIASGVLTLMILVFSEIIPKTLGATYWRRLAPMTAYFLKYLILLLYPFVLLAQKLTSGFSEGSPLKGLNRDELSAMASLSHEGGQIALQEASIVQNILSLQHLTVRDGMTHRTVVFSISEDMTVEAFFYKHGSVVFSRIPLYEGKEPEKINGYVLRTDLLLAQARGNSAYQVSRYRKEMVTLLSSMPLSQTFKALHSKRGNMLLVVDEYGGLEGVLTNEDLLESLLGIEIVDEKDKVVSMKKLAQIMGKRREKSRQERNRLSKSK